MLKIKDNVDLKELEKFGFKKQLYVEYYNKKYKCILWRNEAEDINIFEEKTEDEYYNDDFIQLLREIVIMNKISSYIENEQYSISGALFDLIQSGLVEKVVEE